MKTLSIKTNLLGRAETFKILAVAHVTGYPVLLVGPPGTGKTRALLDYAHGLHNQNAQDALKNTFILETDEGTRPAEIKGRVDMKKLLAPGVDANGAPVAPSYTLNSPIAAAKMILINEIDKANPGLRNSMLGVMNEKMLFNGEEKVFCPWELFCASCNVIPKEEENNPFWDRFVLKHKLSRLTKSQILQYYQMKTKAPVDLKLPDENELQSFINGSITQDLLRHFVEVTFKDMSDRTLSYVPRIIAAVSFVYDMSVKKATIKTCELLTSPEVAKNLASKLEPKAISDIRNKIDYIKTLQNYDQILNQIEDIKNAAKAAANIAEVSKADMQELAEDLNKTLASHAVYSAGNSAVAEALKSGSSKTTWNDATQI
jgi:MoxR-like ATPase